MRTALRLFVFVALVSCVPAALTAQQAPAPSTSAAATRVEPNYELASRWASAKVGKMVFSTAVSPQWLEHSDRFWYEFETPGGKRWWIVDPVKRARLPLWDNAKIAAQLTTILRTPYDAQHLPITAIKFFDKDTIIRFAVDLPKEATVSTDSVLDMKMEVKTEEQLRQERQIGRASCRERV